MRATETNSADEMRGLNNGDLSTSNEVFPFAELLGGLTLNLYRECLLSHVQRFNPVQAVARACVALAR
jgi:hypothetical protein